MAELKVVGHDEVWNRLVHLVKTSKLPSGIAFVGPVGVGKSLVARALAEELHCGNDLLWLEPAGENYKVDQIHELLRKLSLRTWSKHRVVVLEDAEKLNQQSSNALLKVLEEPPEGTYFILITSSLSQLLPTIRSRVQSFRFFSLSEEHLKKLAPEAPSWLVNLSRGQLSELEEWQGEDLSQLLSEAEGALHALGQKDLEGWQNLFQRIKDRQSALKLTKVLQYFFRDLVMDLSESSPTLPFSGRLQSSFSLTKDQLAKAWEKAFELEMNITHNGDRSLLFQNFFYEVHHGKLL